MPTVGIVEIVCLRFVTRIEQKDNKICVIFSSFAFFCYISLHVFVLGSYAHDIGTNFSTLVNLSADNWAQHMTAAAHTAHSHLPTAAAASMLTTATGGVHHHQPQYHPHPASMWNLPTAAASPSCAMSQYLRGSAGYLPTTPETPGSTNTVAAVSSNSSTGVDPHHHTHTTPPAVVSFPSTVVDTPSSSLLTPHSASHPHSLVSVDSVPFNSPIREVKTAVGSWSPLTPPSI